MTAQSVRRSAPITPTSPVPVHATEMEAFLSCRLRWFWTAPKPRGLYLESVSPADPLAFGLAIHAALQHYYDRTEDPYEVFLSTLRDKMGGYRWGFITGTEEEDADLKDHIDLGRAMLDGYAGYAKHADANWHILATETEWETTLGDGLQIAGRFDLVIEDVAGNVWPVDFKTTSATSPGWMEDSVQGMMYVAAARRLYGPAVAGIIFRFLRKKIPYPWDKLIGKSGKLTERSDLADVTTHTEYLRAIAVIAAAKVRECTLAKAHQLLTIERDLWEGTETWNQFTAMYHAAQYAYGTALEKLARSQAFFWDVPVPISPERLAKNENLVLIPTIRMMTHKPYIVPTGLGAAWAVCRRCDFRFPCRKLREETGDDFKELLRSQFKLRDATYEGEATDD